MTDADYIAWLKDPNAYRNVLVEVTAIVGGVPTTRYMSTKAYLTGPSDVPANTVYASILKTGIQYTEQVTMENSASLSVGVVEVMNPDGKRDSWLKDVWVNQSIKAYIGDLRWPRSDYRIIFDGIVADIGSGDRDTLTLSIVDKLQRLNAPISEALLGGTTPNKGSVLPNLFGEGHNITPLLTNPATLEYQINNGAVESIFEVRDNGLPVSATVNNSTGKFTLNQSPAGSITCSAQGDKGDGVYRNTIAKLVQRIVTGYGKASERFTLADIDTANLDAFDAAHLQPVGLPVMDRMNVLSACQELVGSLDAQLIMSRTGLLRIVQISLPASGTPYVVGNNQILEETLEVVGRSKVVAAVKLGFNKNHTVQQGLQTALPAQDKTLFETEWLTETALDTAVRDTYKLHTAPIQKDTLLLKRTDAAAEALRQLNLWKVPRTIYRFTGRAELLQLELGQAITVSNRRYGLSAGVTGMVISLSPDWSNGEVVVEFIA